MTDDKSDLNVYLDTNEDGTRATSDEKEGAGGCCGPRSAPCCGGPATKERKDSPVSPDMEGIDLNEWAGNCFERIICFYLPLTRLESFIQDLCGQAIRLKVEL